MPAYHSMSYSSSNSFSRYHRCSAPIPSIQISFFEYLRQFKTNNSFTNLMTTIFGRQDLITKTNEIKHLAKLVQQLQDEANEQQDYMIGIFNTMKAAGLDQVLGKKYVQDNGIIRKRWGIQFDSSTNDKRSTPFNRPLTPYPRGETSLPQTKKPIHRLRYSATASEYSPTASSYGKLETRTINS